MNPRIVISTTLSVIGLSFTSTSASAADYKLLTPDSGGASSFNTIGNWLDSTTSVAAPTAPAPGNTYTAFQTLRTPATAGNYTFQGDSLTLSSSSASLVNKSGANTITINNFIITGGVVTNTDNVATNRFTLAGNLSLTSGQTNKLQLNSGSAGFNVSSLISGTGALTIASNGSSQSTSSVQDITLTHANNTYSGGTTVGAFSNFQVAADGALGTGNLTMTGGRMTFNLGTTNDYIANTANLIIASGLTTGASNSIALTFTGTDVVGGISLNGGTSFLANGLYDATALNTAYGSSIFSGTGVLSVGAIPEPSTIALLGGLAVMAAAVVKRRRRGACAKE